MHRDRDGSDREIGRHLLAARAGEQDGFTGLYRVLAGRVAGYVRSKGVAEVEDVTNEAFLAAFKNLPSFRGDGAAFRSWLFGITWNKSMDWHRAQARRPPTTAHAHAAVDRYVGDVEDDFLTALGNDDVRSMLQDLTADQRDVLLLRIVADLSLEQTADALGKPVGAIKALQHRALTNLRKRNRCEAVSQPSERTTTGTR